MFQLDTSVESLCFYSVLWQLWRRLQGAAGVLPRAPPLQRHTEAQQHGDVQSQALHSLDS